jgi:hypothetical protein
MPYSLDYGVFSYLFVPLFLTFLGKQKEAVFTQMDTEGVRHLATTQTRIWNTPVSARDRTQVSLFSIQLLRFMYSTS